MRKFGTRMSKLMRYNMKIYPKKRSEASNYREQATGVNLPTPPPTSVGFTKS